MPRPATAEEARRFRELVEQYGLGGAIALRLLVTGALVALVLIPLSLHERVFRSRRRGALWLALVPILGAAVGAVVLVLMGLATGHRTAGATATAGAIFGAGIELLYVVPAAVALARQRYFSNKRA